MSPISPIAARIRGHSQPTSAKTLASAAFALLLCRRLPGGQVLVAKNEEKERLVVAHGEARNLSSRNSVADVDEFVARPIPFDLERGDVVTERDFERCLGSERELADARMQAVGADDQIDLARSSMIEAEPAWILQEGADKVDLFQMFTLFVGNLLITRLISFS